MATMTETMGESCLCLSFLPQQFTGSVSVVLDVFPVEVGGSAKEGWVRGKGSVYHPWVPSAACLQT